MNVPYQTKQVSDFAQLVARFRQEHGMSQGQLAQATRLSRTYVYHLETGQRVHPSSVVVQNIVRALELTPDKRNCLYESYTALTGQHIDSEQFDSTLLDMGELASLLVHNTSYPAHSLDRLWFLRSWNEAAITLFESLGFKAEALLRDHVRDVDGKKHDIVVLGHNVAQVSAQMEAYGLPGAVQQ